MAELPSNPLPGARTNDSLEPSSRTVATLRGHERRSNAENASELGYDDPTRTAQISCFMKECNNQHDEHLDY